MTPEPDDQLAAAAAGRSHLRASHVGREHVVDRLGAAFVQGRLIKDEFDARVGQTFASRTYADLAAVTADIPPGLIGDWPPTTRAGAQNRPPMSKAARARMCGHRGSHDGGGHRRPRGPALFLFTPLYCAALVVAYVQVLGSPQDGRSRRQQLPGPPAPGAGR